MLLDAIAMYVLLSSYKGRNKGIIIIQWTLALEVLETLEIILFLRSRGDIIVCGMSITRQPPIHFYITESTNKAKLLNFGGVK